MEAWQEVVKALQNCLSMREICDFKWSRDVLSPGVSVLLLHDQEIGCDDLAIQVLAGLLQRTSTSLRKLNLRQGIGFNP